MAAVTEPQRRYLTVAMAVIGVCLLIVVSQLSGVAPVLTAVNNSTPTPLTGQHQPVDTDADCLQDPRERRLGTDPADPDTDGDGIRDGFEVSGSAPYPNASPRQLDIYVEIDHMNRTSVPRGALATIERRFAAQNISLHLIINDTIPAKTVDVNRRAGSPTTFKTLRDRYFDRRDHVYHYALIATDLYGSDRLAGKRVGPDFVIEAQPTANRTGFAFMHELGHAVGIAATDSPSIDSRRATFEQYPSVMNYNAKPGVYRFSNGTNSRLDVNDWRRIRKGLVVPNRTLNDTASHRSCPQ
jgi:hypothetical protein